MKSLNFHCFTASAAALARTGSPLKSSTVSTSPISETTALAITLPCTFWDRAADGHSGLTFLTNSRTVESGGAGGLLTFGELLCWLAPMTFQRPSFGSRRGGGTH